MNVKNQIKFKKFLFSSLVIALFIFSLNLDLLSFHRNSTIEEKNSQNMNLDTKFKLSQNNNGDNLYTVENMLNKFTGGFITQDSSGDPTIQYFIQNSGISVGFGESTVKMLLSSGSGSDNPTFTQVTLTFPNSNLVIPIVTEPVRSNSIYFFESNIGVQRQEYLKLVYENLYENIDLEYTIENGNLKYNFYVYPRGDPNNIQIQWNGPLSVEKSINGIEITVNMPSGQKSLIDKKPIAIQNGELLNSILDFRLISPKSYGFFVTSYDKNSVLVIDPSILVMSTFVGGSNDDGAYDMAIDSKGNMYITGITTSSNFPTINSSKISPVGYYDIFVFKFSPDGSSMLYSTYIGGSSYDVGFGIAVDNNGNVYVSGYTSSSDFPTINAFNYTFGGGSDVIIFKLSADGSSLLYSTYIGGSDSDAALRITLDSSGNAYSTGYTKSSNFPTVNAFNDTFGGIMDIFTLKLSATGSSLIYSTYIGGSNDEASNGIAIDSSDNVFVTGYTESADFPILNAYSMYGGNRELIIFKLSSDGSSLIYSTYIGGSNDDTGIGVAIDDNGNVYVTGLTRSSDFPTVNAYDTTYGGGDQNDVICLKLSSDWSSLLYSTYVGGSMEDAANDIIVDSSGNVYVTGYTSSSNFPAVNAYNSTFGGNYDIFVFKLSSNGSTLFYSTFIGGSKNDYGYSIAIDTNWNTYIAGLTMSGNFPIINAYNSTFGGNSDVVVLKITTPPSKVPSSPYNLTATAGDSKVTLEWSTPINDSESQISGFHIYRSTTSGIGYTFVKTVYNNQFTDTGVNNGITYYYIVTAVNIVGESVYSNEASVMPQTLTTTTSTSSSQSLNKNISTITTTPIYPVSLLGALSLIVILKRKQKNKRY